MGHLKKSRYIYGKIPLKGDQEEGIPRRQPCRWNVLDVGKHSYEELKIIIG